MNVKIVCDNIWCHVFVQERQIDVDVLLSKALRYRPEGYQYTWAFKHKKSDGYTLLYNGVEHKFRSGLLRRVMDLLSGAGYSVELEEVCHVKEPVEHKLIPGIIKQYGFQTMAAAAIVANKLGIIVSPCGTGKTVIIALGINALKCKSLVLVTDVCLLDQMQQALQRYFDQPIGSIGDGEFDIQNITVSTIQSIASILKAKSAGPAAKVGPLTEYLRNVGVVISDEGHLYDSKGVSELMPNFANTSRFYAFSATPYGWAEKMPKRQNIELEQHFGTVIYDCRDNDFIALGLKVPLYVQVLNREALRSEYSVHKKWDNMLNRMTPDHTKNYRQCLEDEVLNNQAYHDDVAKCARGNNAAGKSVFVHAAHSIEFGVNIHKLIPNSVLVNGSTPRLERRRIYEEVRQKRILSLVSDVGGTGLDITTLNTLIIASDVTDIRQLKGRVERSAPGKDAGLLVDVRTNSSFLSKHHETRRCQYEYDNNLVIG